MEASVVQQLRHCGRSSMQRKIAPTAPSWHKWGNLSSCGGGDDFNELHNAFIYLLRTLRCNSQRTNAIWRFSVASVTLPNPQTPNPSPLRSSLLALTVAFPWAFSGLQRNAAVIAATTCVHQLRFSNYPAAIYMISQPLRGTQAIYCCLPRRCSAAQLFSWRCMMSDVRCALGAVRLFVCLSVQLFVLLEHSIEYPECRAVVCGWRMFAWFSATIILKRQQQQQQQPLYLRLYERQKLFMLSLLHCYDSAIA